jgi:general stress protein 26
MNNEQHLYDLLKEFDTAMMITEGAHPQTHARPMAIAELQRDADAYFVASLDSPKVKEIEANGHVTLTFQSARQFAALYGTVSVVRDRAQIDRLWNEAWKVWFPKGKDDPSITLLKFTPDHGEYWNNAGMQGIKYALKAVSAYVSGTTPDSDASQHGKVSL